MYKGTVARVSIVRWRNQRIRGSGALERRVGQRRKSLCGNQLQDGPSDPCFLLFTLLCIHIPPYTRVYLCDQQHTAEAKVGQDIFNIRLEKAVASLLGTFLLSCLLGHSLRKASCYVLSSPMERHKCPTVSKELRPGNNRTHKHRSRFYDPSQTLR